MYNSLYGTDPRKHVQSVSVGVSSIIMNIIMIRQLYNYDCWLCALYMYNSLYGTNHRKHVQSVSVGVSSDHVGRTAPR